MQAERINVNLVCRICLQISDSKMVPLKRFKAMLEKFANIEIKESKLLPAKICEPCSQLLKASRVLQANIFEANEEWEDIYARKCYLTTAGLSRIQDRVERSATRLYDYFNEDDEVHEYNEIVVQRVKVIQDLQNCGGCLTPFNRFPKKNIEESLQAQVTEPTSNENEDDDDEEVEPEVNHPHQLCFDCVENLEKTLTVVKNCRRVNLNGWRVSQCLLCREEKRLQGGGNAPKNLRDFAIMWNEQNSAEKIALSSSYICKSCQLRLTDAMKFRYHILKIEEALIPHGESKWNGYTDDPGTRSRIYTFVEQASALLEPKKKEVKKTYEPDNVETVDNSAAIVAYDHEFDFEWNKVPVSYDSDSSDTDIETFQLNQPFYQKFIQCDECHKEIHELDYELHKETHEWSGRKCHYCDEEMKISSTLVSHILRRHKKYKGFLCEICGVALFSANCFLAHTNRIHPTKMFICPKCPKTFKMKKYLDNHLRIHLNLQPYRCKFCDRRFNDKSDMNWHELTHTGNYKHFCQYCQKGFAKPRLVLIHERQCKNKTHQPMDSD